MENNEEILRYIEQKKDSYRNDRQNLQHQSEVANKLEFDLQVSKIQRDRAWLMSIIELLSDIENKIKKK